VRITKVHVRFFRSFNFDSDRKSDRRADRPAWEMVDGIWYPFVRVPLDKNVTAVVGANESGKTHLIDAIDRALTGKRIDRGDFCRYSDLYEVEKGSRRNPDFGLSLRLESEDDLKALPKLSTKIEVGAEVTLLRLGDGRISWSTPTRVKKKSASRRCRRSRHGCPGRFA
jgi:AAA15 family ATPase/GTPase